MPIFRSSYDTTLGVAITTKPIEHAIKEAMIRDGIDCNTLDLITSELLLPVFITGMSSSESNIPFFVHPLIIENHNKNNYLCADIRPYIRNQQPITPKNATEFNFVKSRTILNLAWLARSPLELKNTLSFAGSVFSAWISEIVTKRFALDPKDQLILAIISHYYFQSLHYPEDQFDEDMLQMFAVHTMKATKAPSQLVFEIFDKIGRISNLNDFCTAVTNVLENIRLKDFNSGILITCAGSSWFGLNAKEIIAVSLEHPPTWYAIVYTSLVERSYRNSMISRISERYGKNKAGDDYIKCFVDLVKTYQVADSPNPAFKSFE